jgi:hypothetical protein
MHYNLINPNIREIIRLSTNKYIDSKSMSKDYYFNEKPTPNFLLIPLVSLISFLAGYNFHKLTN